VQAAGGQWEQVVSREFDASSTVHCIGALRRAGAASTDLSWSMAQRRNYSAITDLDTNVPATGMRANHAKSCC